MAEHPKSLILMQHAQDFEILRDFCFREGVDFIKTEVAGHREVALFGSPIPVLNYSSQQQIGILFYPLVDLGSTSPPSLFHPNTPKLHLALLTLFPSLRTLRPQAPVEIEMF